MFFFFNNKKNLYLNIYQSEAMAKEVYVEDIRLGIYLPVPSRY